MNYIFKNKYISNYKLEEKEPYVLLEKKKEKIMKRKMTMKSDEYVASTLNSCTGEMAFSYWIFGLFAFSF